MTNEQLIRKRLYNFAHLHKKAQKAFDYYQLMIDNNRSELDREKLLKERDIAVYSLKKYAKHIAETEKELESFGFVKKAKKPKVIRKTKSASTERFTERITVLLTPSEYKAINDAAIDGGYTRSTWARLALLAALKGEK